MPYTAAQIVFLANQQAKTPGFATLAGQKLNIILAELCQTYDFELAMTTNTSIIAFNTSGGSGPGHGSGPYTLPTDYLRCRKGMLFYVYNGVPYFMTPIELEQYDRLVQQAGINDFPRDFATDMSQSPPVLYVWPPPSINVPVTLRYYRQMPDITNPETSAVVPWFPNQSYLITRLTGEMCQIADDTRAESFLSDNADRYPGGAGVILNRYLKMKDDKEGKADQVQLDRRLFGTNFSRLPNTKTIGW